MDSKILIKSNPGPTEGFKKYFKDSVFDSADAEPTTPKRPKPQHMGIVQRIFHKPAQTRLPQGKGEKARRLRQMDKIQAKAA